MLTKQQLEQVLGVLQKTYDMDLLEYASHADLDDQNMDTGYQPKDTIQAIETIKQAIADYDKSDGAVAEVKLLGFLSPHLEIVEYAPYDLPEGTKLYLRPEQKRVPMSEDEINELFQAYMKSPTYGYGEWFIRVVKATEQHHGVTE